MKDLLRHQAFCFCSHAVSLFLSHPYSYKPSDLFFSTGTINVVPWVYGPEVLPLEARARGTAISVASHWMWNFFVVMITPVLINRLGWKTYLIFMCTNLAFVPTVYFFYPETSNISLEGIDQIFLDKNRKPWHKAYVEDRLPGDSASEEETEKGSGGDGVARHQETVTVGGKV